jgi:hypothetical protein
MGSFPNWIYQDTGTNSDMGLLNWSVQNQKDTWKDFIYRMSQRMGKTSMVFDVASLRQQKTFFGRFLSRFGDFETIDKITFTLNNRGYDTNSDIMFKAMFWAATFPSDAAAEAFNMTMGLPHGFEGEYNGRTSTGIDPHDPRVRAAFNSVYGNTGLKQHKEISGARVDPGVFKDQYLSTLNERHGATFRVGQHPAGSHGYNTIRERTLRGPGRDAHYGQSDLVPGLVPHRWIIPLIVALAVTIWVVVYLALDNSAELQTHAMNIEHVENMAAMGYEVEVGGRQTGFSASTDGENLMVSTGGTTGALTSGRRATTAQNQPSGRGGQTIQSVNPVNMVQLIGQVTGQPTTTTPMQVEIIETEKPAEGGALVPLGIGALAYFLI